MLGGGLMQDIRLLCYNFGCCLHNTSKATMQAKKETVMRLGCCTSSRMLKDDASAATA